MSSEVLLKVRERMQKIKDKIEEAEEREQNAKTSLKEVEATYDQHESDIDSMKKRISLLQKELDEKRVLLEERKMKSEEYEEKCVQESEVVRTLESVEIDEDERLHQIETDLAETTVRADTMELQNTELKQKLGQLENEIQKVWAMFRTRWKFSACHNYWSLASRLGYQTDQLPSRTILKLIFWDFFSGLFNYVPRLIKSTENLRCLIFHFLIAKTNWSANQWSKKLIKYLDKSPCNRYHPTTIMKLSQITDCYRSDSFAMCYSCSRLLTIHKEPARSKWPFELHIVLPENSARWNWDARGVRRGLCWLFCVNSALIFYGWKF